MPNPTTPSLKIERPLGGVLLRAVLVVLVVLAAAEGLARTSWVQHHLESPSLGNYHYQFEIKWFQLQRYAAAHDGVDVILLGSSLVNSGIQPEAVNQSWAAHTGEKPLRIYNFGVEGFTIEPNSYVARLLVETYHPQVIVFGTEIRDYADNNGVEVAENFLSDPWVQYQQGSFSLSGWLTTHSAAYRYFLAFRNWMRWDFSENYNLIQTRTGKLTEDGYDVENRTVEGALPAPDPADPEDAEAFETFADFKFSTDRLAMLKSLLGLARKDVQVVIVEMPVSPTFYQYFEDGEGQHQAFLNSMSATVNAGEGIFLPAFPEEDLPPNSRSDRVHLNKTGAVYFSEQLGVWLAELYNQGQLTLEVQP